MSRKNRGDKKRRKTIISKFRKREPLPEIALIPVLVVFNEEKRLPDWFKAHQHFKKMVILDQHSTDGTVAIIEKEMKHRDIRLLSNHRFEHFGEPDFNLALQMVGEKDAGFLLAPDEFVDEDMHKEISRRVRSAFKKYGTRAFYISRKNMLGDKCINHLFVMPTDPDGKNWQLRISINNCIKFHNTAHTQPEASAEWGYLSDSVYIEHRKNLEDEQESIRKRSIALAEHARKRDAGFVKELEKLEGKND